LETWRARLATLVASMNKLIRASGLAAILGTLLYAASDVLLVGVAANLVDYPNLQPHVRLLGTMVKMVAVPEWRLVWGALLGIFAAPLTVAGFWQMHRGLARAGLKWSLPPMLLFCWAQIVSPFLHGSHIYLGEYVQALNRLSPDCQPALLGMIERQHRLLGVTLLCMVSCVVIASAWYSVLVVSGRSAFPRWLAAFTPITVFLTWSVLRKVLPAAVAVALSGAGINIGFLVFFSLNTWALWRKELFP